MKSTIVTLLILSTITKFFYQIKQLSSVRITCIHRVKWIFKKTSFGAYLSTDLVHFVIIIKSYVMQRNVRHATCQHVLSIYRVVNYIVIAMTGSSSRGALYTTAVRKVRSRVTRVRDLLNGEFVMICGRRRCRGKVKTISVMTSQMFARCQARRTSDR